MKKPWPLIARFCSLSVPITLPWMLIRCRSFGTAPPRSLCWNMVWLRTVENRVSMPLNPVVLTFATLLPMTFKA